MTESLNTICQCGLDVQKLAPIHRFHIEKSGGMSCFWCVGLEPDPIFPRPEPGQEGIYRGAALPMHDETVEEYKSRTGAPWL